MLHKEKYTICGIALCLREKSMKSKIRRRLKVAESLVYLKKLSCLRVATYVNDNCLLAIDTQQSLPVLF